MPPTSSLSPLPGLLRFALIVFHAGMILLAVVYLRRRKLSLAGYLTWGLFAALVPYLGPFLLIYLQPGTPLPQQERTPGPSHWRASLYTFLRKLDSYPKPKRKSSPPRIPPEV